MAKVRLNVNKLGDPTVNYISLVSRGANRIPFRIVKHEQEQSMIDLASLNLSKLFKGEKAIAESTVPQPTIVGFVTMKDENFDIVKKHLKDAGYKISDLHEESDGSVVFKQQDELPEEFSVLKMADSLLVLVDGIDAEEAVEGTIYESLLQEDSFLPSQEIAAKGMQLAMTEISATDDSAKDKVAKMELVTKDYNGYMSKLFNWVPAQLNVMAALLEKEIAARAGVKPEASISELRGEAQASSTQASDKDQNIGQQEGIEAKGTPGPIPLDNALPKDLKKDVQGVGSGYNSPLKKSEEAESVSKAGKNPFPFKAKGAGKDTDEDAVDGEDADGDSDDAKKAKFNFAKKAEEDTAAQTTALLQKMESMFGTLQASIGEQIGAITAQVSTLNDSVEGIKKSQDVLHDRVVETEKIAKSADTTIRSKLITTDMSNDGTSNVRKAAAVDEFVGGAIDTAFQQSVRKAAHPVQRGRAGR